MRLGFHRNCDRPRGQPDLGDGNGRRHANRDAMKRIAPIIVAMCLVPAGGAAAADWVAPLHLWAPGGANPDVAVNDRGGAVVGWCGGNPAGTAYAVVHRHGEWKFARPIVTSDYWSCDQRVGIDAAGNALVIAPQRSRLEVVARDLRAGADEWEPAALIGAGPGGPYWAVLALVDLEVNAAGDAIAAWTRGTSWDTKVLEVAYRRRGGAWERAEQLSVVGAGIAGADVALDAAGNATAFWLRGTYEAAVPWVAQRGADGRWTVVSDIGPPGKYVSSPVLAVNARGDAVVAWQAHSLNGTYPSPPIVHTSVRRGLNWETTAMHTSSVYDAFALGVDGAGTVLLTIAKGAGTIEALTRRATGAWTTPTTIATNAPMYTRPMVDVAENGAAVVAWENSGTWAARRDSAEGAWDSPRRIATAPAFTPRVAANASGDALIARGLQNPTGIDVTVFDATAPEVGSVSVPRRVVAGRAARFSVVPSDAWSRLRPTAWRFGDGSTARGVSVKHIFRRPGRYRITVTALDRSGNAASTTRTILVARR